MFQLLRCLGVRELLNGLNFVLSVVVMGILLIIDLKVGVGAVVLLCGKRRFLDCTLRVSGNGWV